MACKQCDEPRVRDGFDFCCSYCARDYESEHPTDFEYEVCERCQGHGKHTNPSIDGNGLTSSELVDLGEEFLEDYLRGIYDVRCEKCNGQRVVDNKQSTRLKEIEDHEAYMEMRAESPHMFR